jgi:hypothetical protein
MARTGPYKHMTPEAQRQVDWRDVEILRMRDAGKTYAQIIARLDIKAPTIARVIKECGNAT